MPSPFTLSGLQDAWDRVLHNQGCAGVDGVTVERFARNAAKNVGSLHAELASGAYRPLPLLKILVEKRPGSGKTRRLLVPPVRDRILQTAAAHHLSASFEEEFLDSSFAYRPGRSVDRAIARIIQLRDRGFQFVVDADISSFFDEVEHNLLLRLLAAQNLPTELSHLLHLWIHAEVWDGKRVTLLRKGIAQGSPLSPLLANFFLDEFDLSLEQTDHHLIRFADDFLILCQSSSASVDALQRATLWMASRSLDLNPVKTRLTNFKEGFHFLGVYFIEDRVYTPWKGERPKGHVFFMAHPMPRHLLQHYQRPVSQSVMETAISKSGLIIESAPIPSGGGPLVAFLYLTEQGAVLRKSGDRFLIEKDDRILLDLPYHKLECVLVFGNIQLTTQAIAELLEKRIPVSFFSSQGRFRGSLSMPQGKDVLLRIAQFNAYSDSAQSLRLARRVISAKIANAKAVLRHYAENDGQLHAVQPAIDRLGQALADLEAASSLASIEGIEGACAHLYFTSLMSFNRSQLVWPGRVKHPATDPLNSLLSLGYTLVMHEFASILEGLGLDPYLGFLHQPDFGRLSLALDLLELFRHPLVDRFVLHLVNRRSFDAADFHTVAGSDGMFLAPEPMKRFFQAYEQWMLTRTPSTGLPFRQLLRAEAESLVHSLHQQEEWTPFLWSSTPPSPPTIPTSAPSPNSS
ncbi:MAG: CRISPR-associated endonuclease Cas1 [Bryobacterales bacterium]|nr:CRISPR-associated endonuclease Cas1 [Bryobacterales bacterium]